MASHPDLETLLAYASGELAPDALAGVAEHVAGCWDCRLESGRLAGALAAPAGGRPGNPGEVDPQHLARVLDGIHQWREKTLAPARCEEVARRVREILEPYLGISGANAVVRPIAGDSQRLLATVEPVLALFLGKEAAAILVNEIVEEALLET